MNCPCCGTELHHLRRVAERCDCDKCTKEKLRVLGWVEKLKGCAWDGTKYRTWEIGGVWWVRLDTGERPYGFTSFATAVHRAYECRAIEATCGPVPS